MPKFPSLAVALLFSIACLSAGAQTNLGSVSIGSSATTTVTVTVPAATSFTTIKVVTMGATGLDFNMARSTCTLGTAYAAGQTCTVGVTFKPLHAGLRMGAVVLSNSSTGVYNTVYLQGFGEGPQFAFNPGVATAIDPVLNGQGLWLPSSVAVDGTGTLFILDYQVASDAVIKAPSGDATPSTIIAHGASGDNIDSLSAVAIDGAGNRIIVGADKKSVPLAVRIPPGANVGQEYSIPTDQFTQFSAVAVDGAGDLFLLNMSAGYVVEFPIAPSNAPPVYYALQPDGIALDYAIGLAVDYAGNLFVGDPNNNRVVKLPAGGGTAITIQPIVDGLAVHPVNLAVDGVGNLYMADSGYPSPAPRVVEVPVGGGPAFAIQPVVNGIPIFPSALSFDLAGNLFIADTEGNSSSSRIVEVERSQSALNFATTRVDSNSTDSPQIVQVQNVGTLPLKISAPDYPIDFPEDVSATDPCTVASSLTTGETCNLTIDFHPLSSGTKAESIELSDPSYTYASGKVSLNGTGRYLVLSASSLSYAPQQVNTASASQQLTLTNTNSSALTIHGIQYSGANASSFLFGSTCTASLPAGQSCTIHGHFTPTTIGPLSATITITDSEADSPQSIALTGTGLAPPTATLSSTSLSFGTVQTGTTGGSQQVTLTNTGGSNLTIPSIAITGPNASSFVFGYDCSSSLTPGGSCTIHGHFAPQVDGALSAAITIVDNASGSPQQVALTGTGTSTPITTVSVSPSSLNFGNQVVGRAGNSQAATLTNTGSGTLTFESAQIIGPNHSSFSFTLGCAPTLAPGASCGISGHFTPTGLGPQTASVIFNVNLAGPPPTISLTGVGVPPAAATYSATQINFGTVAVGQRSPSQDITLTNTGDAPMHIFSFEVGGANASSFGFGNTCGDLVAINASCTIHGHFAPTTTGPLTATISIEDDAGPRAENTVQTITVTGTGQ